jgi:Uncharacterized conserved protein (COG2071)
MRRPFLTAQWRHLAMLNGEVEPDLLTALVPPGTVLDLHAGRCLVSVVGLPDAGSEEEFVSEHYWGYAGGRRGTLEYRVEHARWPVRRGTRAELDCDAERLYGPCFAAALEGPPMSAFLAAGSSVSVYPGQRLGLAAFNPERGRSSRGRPDSPPP